MPNLLFRIVPWRQSRNRANHLDTARLSFAHFTPIPPLPLFNRKIRILSLSYGGNKNVMATWVQPLPLKTTKFIVHPLRIAASKISYAVDSKQFEISEDSWTN